MQVTILMNYHIIHTHATISGHMTCVCVYDDHLPIQAMIPTAKLIVLLLLSICSQYLEKGDDVKE